MSSDVAQPGAAGSGSFAASTLPELRVLVVDDSAYNRSTITQMLEARPGVKVIGRAVNGKEALKVAFETEPDAITLDLEMPEMDGFSFLRLLMSRRPTPVIVISGYSQRENVFRALELGAMDFIAKPARHISPDIREIADELGDKIALVRRLQAVRLKQRADSLAAAVRAAPPAERSEPRSELPTEPATGIVVVASSTGGPPAIQQFLAPLGEELPVAVVIAQHMPPRFTKAFAQRLDRVLALRVVEAQDGMTLARGVVYVAPGQQNIELVPAPAPALARIRLIEPEQPKGGAPMITPSADVLFKSAAEHFGNKTLGVVLTGMGSDGAKGAITLAEMGGRVFVEDPATAVMPGMPQSAVDTGVVERALSLDGLAAEVENFSRGLELRKG